MWERACSRRRSVSQHMYELTHRFREQARSHIEMRLILEMARKLRGCGKLRGYKCRDRRNGLLLSHGAME